MTRSLSNLYKQYWVTNQQDNARVINANAVLEERMAKILERQRAEQRRHKGGCRQRELVCVKRTHEGDQRG